MYGNSTSTNSVYSYFFKDAVDFNKVTRAPQKSRKDDLVQVLNQLRTSKGLNDYKE